MADTEKWKTDDAYRGQVNADYEKMFAEADSNNNGLLDLKEYMHHCTLNDAYNNKKFEGAPVTTP